MELRDHALRIGEAPRIELPRSVAELPGIVDHEDARRKPVVEHGLRVGQDVLLVLEIGQLDPRVVLRRGEIQQLRFLACRREIGLRGKPKGLRKGLARVFGQDNSAAIRDELDRATADRRLDWRGTVQDAPPVRDKNGLGLMRVIADAKIALEIGFLVKRHLPSEVAAEPPPVLTGQHPDGQLVRAGQACRRACQKQQKQ